MLLAGAAAAADVIEGASLLSVLNGTGTAVNARRARRAALTKFGFLAVALGYVGWRIRVDHVGDDGAAEWVYRLVPVRWSYTDPPGYADPELLGVWPD